MENQLGHLFVPTSQIDNLIWCMLKRPLMYFQTKEALEDAYFLLTSLRGNRIEAEREIAKVSIPGRPSNRPIAPYLSDLEATAKFFRVIEEKISYIKYGVTKDKKEMSDEKLLEDIVNYLITNGYAIERKEELKQNEVTDSKYYEQVDGHSVEKPYKPEF